MKTKTVPLAAVIVIPVAVVVLLVMLVVFYAVYRRRKHNTDQNRSSESSQNIPLQETNQSPDYNPLPVAWSSGDSAHTSISPTELTKAYTIAFKELTVQAAIGSGAYVFGLWFC